MINLQEQLIDLQGNLKFSANSIVEGFISGLHKSPYHGFSVEFSNYKSYSAGDSINLIDWKVYSKTDRYYIKRFEEETNVRVHFLLDISKSMSFSSHNIVKIDYAKLLVASLMNLSFKQRDAVGLITYNEKIINNLPAKSKTIWFTQLLKTLDNIKCEDSTNLTDTIFACAEKVKKRSLFVIVTDFLDDLESINKALNYLKFSNHHCILFHICDNIELNFNFKNDAEFIDMEDASILKISPQLIQKDYLNQYNMFHVKLKQIIENLKYEYYQVNTLTPIELALKQFFCSRTTRFI